LLWREDDGRWQLELLLHTVTGVAPALVRVCARSGTDHAWHCADTTCLKTEGGLLAGLTQALQDKLSRDSILVTTDYQMGEGFTLLKSLDGLNDQVGGISTGYIYRKE
jgi:hypothetical protein